MKYIAAYLLLRMGGNSHPTAEDIKHVLGSVGISADEDRLNKLISELDGKDVEELIKLGSEKLAVFYTGSQGPTSVVNTTDVTIKASPAVQEESDTDDDGIDINIFGDPDDDF